MDVAGFTAARVAVDVALAGPAVTVAGVVVRSGVVVKEAVRVSLIPGVGDSSITGVGVSVGRADKAVG
jgi:hypothetical protein